MATVKYLPDPLDSITIDDIIEHLEERQLSRQELRSLADFVRKEANKKDMASIISEEVLPETLCDQLKVQLFAEVFEKYSLTDLQRRLA